jgi:hypothetical protein
MQARSRKAMATIEIRSLRAADGTIEGHASATLAEAGKSALTLVVAVTQDGVTSKPSAGENKGETLAQNFVVRDVAEFRGQSAIEGNFRFAPKANWNPERMTVVAYVQDSVSVRRAAGAVAPVCRS